jgi:hypothetical protein
VNPEPVPAVCGGKHGAIAGLADETGRRPQDGGGIVVR